MHRQPYLNGPLGPMQSHQIGRSMHSTTPNAYAHPHHNNNSDQPSLHSPTSAEAGPSSASYNSNGVAYNGIGNMNGDSSVASGNDSSASRAPKRAGSTTKRRTTGDDAHSETSSATSHIPKTRDGPKKKKAARACASCQKAHLTCDDSRPCQRCIKRGMGDQCVEGHRKKAKYLLDEAELEALKNGQQMPTKETMQTTPPAPVSAPQPILQQPPPPPPEQYNNGAEVLFNLPFLGDPTFTFGSEAANMEYSSLSALLGLDLSPDQQDFQYGTAGGQQPDFSTQHQFASREWPESPSSNLSGGTVVPQQNGMGMPQSSLDGMYGPVPGPQALFGGSTIGPQRGDMSQQNQQTPSQQMPMDVVSNSYPSPGMQYPPVRSNSQASMQPTPQPQQSQPPPPPQASPQQPYTPSLRVQGTTPKPIQAQVSTTSVATTAAGTSSATDHSDNLNNSVAPLVSPPTSDANSPAEAVTGNSTTAINSRNNSLPGASGSVPESKAHLSYVSVTKAYDYVESYHFLMKFLAKRFEKNDILRVVRALAIFRPSLIALQTPLSEEDEIFVERCFQRSLVELEKLISFSGTPAVVWRRTGEICLVGQEFCLLTEWKKEELVGGRKFIYELFENQSVVEYWEKFASHAFENTTQSVFSHCVLLKPSGEPIPCTFCFSIRRDIFDLPSVVIGQWLPLV